MDMSKLVAGGPVIPRSYDTGKLLRWLYNV